MLGRTKSDKLIFDSTKFASNFDFVNLIYRITEKWDEFNSMIWIWDYAKIAVN